VVTEEFFLNNEKHETTRKNFMEAALTAEMHCSPHEIFSGRSCFSLFKNTISTQLHLTYNTENRRILEKIKIRLDKPCAGVKFIT